MFVGQGSVVQLGTGQYEILSVDKPDGAPGSVRFSPIRVSE